MNETKGPGTAMTMTTNLRNDFDLSVRVAFESNPWVASPEPGVLRKLLERDGGEVARATSIVEYQPGSRFPMHTHLRGEEFVVLKGIFSDKSGDFPQGSYVRNPPRSYHAPNSTDGCIIFVKLRQFGENDLARRVVAPSDENFVKHEGVSTKLLHTFEEERVTLVRLDPGVGTKIGAHGRGAEILVLDGEINVNAVASTKWDWSRTPHSSVELYSREGALVWIKQGHLVSEQREM